MKKSLCITSKVCSFPLGNDSEQFNFRVFCDEKYVWSPRKKKKAQWKQNRFQTLADPKLKGFRLKPIS